MNLKRSASKSIEQAIFQAIRYLENERVNQYKESTHIMRFPRSAGFTSENEVHTGLIFQLTIILDALIGCLEAGYIINENGVNKDMEKIIQLKDKNLNSWKYFPILPELPPDIDDLAQIIQIFLRKANYELHDVFDAINGLVLRFVNSNGSINTWIFDHENQTPEYHLMRKATETMWGENPDVEVIANYLYSLFLLNNDKYEKFIDNGIRYILKKQKQAGYWTSTWYWGNYYGTYICARLLMQYPEYHSHLERTLQYILRNQNDDGSWDKSKYASNNTAFAILTLIELHHLSDDLNEPISNGISYLCSKQYTNGSWQAADFIKMKTDRVSGFIKMLLKLRGSNILTYKSHTATTAIVLKALSQYSVFKR